MLLTIQQRLAILQALPPVGDLMTMRIVADLKHDLGLKEAEFEAYNIRREGELIVWDDDSSRAEIEIGPQARVIIHGALAAMDKAKQLTMQHVELCEMFGYEGEPEEVSANGKVPD